MVNMQGQDRPMFLLDGFPRNVAQAVDFESKVRSSNEFQRYRLTLSTDLQRLRNHFARMLRHGLVVSPTKPLCTFGPDR
jgi:adenylate kinase family enzyme